MISSISTVLKTASKDLSSLDAEVLLAHVLQVSRSYLFAHPEEILTPEQENKFFELAKKCAEGEPVAYLTGHREFWSLDFKVTSDTLIPRPETELLVECVLKNIKGQGKTIADLGTGCGAIALAIAHERPDWEIFATDLSEKALSVARENASRLGIKNVVFCEGSWCEALPAIRFDAIVSNPPYIGEGDFELQPSVLFYEPRSALISSESGFGDLEKIIEEAPAYLTSGGSLFLEHGFLQAEKIKKRLTEAGYIDINLHRDFAGLYRVAEAKWPISSF